MVKQKRPDEMVGILEADFQSRYEHAFAWSTVCATFQFLPGLRAFWPCGSIDENAYMIDQSGQANHLINDGPVTINTRPLPPYAEFDGQSYLYFESD